MALTNVEIRAAKRSETRQKLSDSRGLQLWVEPTGSKLWHYAYRFDGKQKVLALGAYPAIGLSDARTARDEANKLLKTGVDPSQDRKTNKLTKAHTNKLTFDLIAGELLEKNARQGLAKTTLKKKEWFRQLAKPDMGEMAISEISPAIILAVLRKIEAKGKLDTAKSLQTFIGEVFRFAVQTARAENDPTIVLRGAILAPQVKHRAAILEPKAVGELLRAIDSIASLDVKAALQLLMLNMTRPCELRLAEWREFDLEAAVWVIPAAKMKMREEHRVPLSHQAIEILRSLKAMSGGLPFVFPSYRGKGRPMSEATMNAALRRLGYTSNQVQPHGFRSTASTLLNESGKFSPDAIERALSHKDKDTIRGTYSRGSFWEERVRMAQYWADYLDTLRTGAKVISFNGASAVSEA